LTRTTKLLALFAIGASLFGAPAPAAAQQQGGTAATAEAEKKARDLFAKGTELAAAVRWTEACPYFQQAHDAFPTNGTALRLADCYEKIDKPGLAYDLYAYIVNNASAEKHAERVDIAKARMAAIEEKRRVAAEEAAKFAPTSPSTGAPPPPPPAPPPDRIPVYAAFGAGAAGLVIGTIFGIVALSEAATVKDACPEAKCSTPALLAEQQDQKDGAVTKGWIANVGFGVAIVGAAVGVVLLMTEDGRNPPKSARALNDRLVLRF
jgi:hypothetical protein